MRNLCTLLLACICLACSPQKRLARLVSHHPELLQLDTLALSQKIYIDAERATTHIAPSTFPLDIVDHLPDIQVAVQDARAILHFDTLGGASLQLERQADTLELSTHLPLPRIVVDTNNTDNSKTWWKQLESSIIRIALVIGGILFTLSILSYLRTQKRGL